MISLQLETLAARLNAKLYGNNISVIGVSTDTRTLATGDLFIALSGENFDANSFVASAAEKGAAAAIVTKKQPVDIPQLVVKDTRLALGALGKLVREQLTLQVAALTGSNGKTTTKEMLAAILKQVAPTLATAGNFNNDIGVPLTLLRLQPEHEFAVLELGANHKKEIAYTTSLVLPDVVLINNVDAAHLEGFGDLQGVAQAKGEILTGIKHGGTAVLNRDDKFYDYWLRKIDPAQHVSFSLRDPQADYFAHDIEFDELGCAGFTLVTPKATIDIQLTVSGRHNVANALAAAAMASCFNIELAIIKLGLESVANVQGRLLISQLDSRIRIIDDTYNANIASAKAAIDVLSHFKSQNVLVMGDMGELGVNTAELHQQVGEYAQLQNVDNVFTCGVLSRETALSAGTRGRAFLDQTSLVDALQLLIANSDEDQHFTLLFKGSRSAKMEQAIALLRSKLTASTSMSDPAVISEPIPNTDQVSVTAPAALSAENTTKEQQC